MVHGEHGLLAVTRYRVRRAGRRFSLVECWPETGRTHQIRVHLEAIGCPLVGDKIYGVPPEVFLAYLDGGGDAGELHRERLVIDRHALHSHRLVFRHPQHGPGFTLEAPLPADLEALLEL